MRIKEKAATWTDVKYFFYDGLVITALVPNVGS